MKKVFLIIQSFLCVLLAVLLITAVIVIYRSGAAARAEDPLAAIFSREVAAEVLRAIAPLFFAETAMTFSQQRLRHFPEL